MSPIHSGAQMVGGTISGEVMDPGGAALSHAEVVIRNDETGSQRKFVTGESGAFSAPSVSVGAYSVLIWREVVAVALTTPAVADGAASAVGVFGVGPV